MADNTKIGPIFRGANGGISDDLFTGIRNSYFYSNKIEIREDSKSIYPSDGPIITGSALSYILGTETAKPVAMLMTKNSGDDMFIFVNKSVYVVDTSDYHNSAELLCTFDDKIHDAEAFNNYIYITTEGGLYMISDTANSTTWGNLPSESTVTGTPYHGKIKGFSDYVDAHPLFASDVALVCGENNELLKISKETCNTYSTGLALQEGYIIRMITELGGFLRIVADDGMFGSEIILWDKVSAAPNEVIPFEGYQFFQTCIYNGYQYLLSDKGLGVLNGYQYYILKKAQEGNVASTAKNGMCVFDDKIYFVTSTGIFIYGAKNKNYNDVLSLWVEMGNCGCLYTDGIRLFTSCGKRDNFAYSMCGGTIKGEIMQSSGEFQTMAYFGTSLSEIKQSEYLRVGYKLPIRSKSLSGRLYIYYRTEADAVNNNSSSWAWHELTPRGGLGGSSDARSPFATTFKLNCRFQWIQFKFVLDNCPAAGGGQLYTHLYSADLYYNTMLD